MKNISAFLFLILILTLPSCKFFKGKKLFGKKDDVMSEWLVKQDSIRVADSIRAVQDHLLALENARLDSIRAVDEARRALESQYNIIVGSFITPEYARECLNEYRNMGYDAKIIQAEGSGFEFVSAESHSGLGRALARLAQFQDTVQIEAWIYTKR
ncbi:MAG: hypothetical protein JXN62_00510 [Bacteroidales bacterium]|nr:hypothetical protein [Bacteroidales bacterium]